MNARFFDVKKSKQDAIINAALKIFSINGYKNASTDVIVKEAGISKGLLFHYFGSKQGLYEFIYDYSVKYMTLELTRTVNRSEKDFFVVQVQVTRAKTRVMKNYPYMEQFLNNSRSETDPEALEAIGDLRNVMGETYNNIYSQTDNTKFMDRLDIVDVINMISWMSDGFIREKFRNPDFNLDDMNDEFEKFLNLLRRHFYRSPGNDMLSIARDEMIERNEDVMDKFRLKASFEERLKAGRNTIFEGRDSSEDEEKSSDGSVETVSEKEDAAATQDSSIDSESTKPINGGEKKTTASEEGAIDSNSADGIIQGASGENKDASHREIAYDKSEDAEREDDESKGNEEIETENESDSDRVEEETSDDSDDIALPSWWVGSSSVDDKKEDDDKTIGVLSDEIEKNADESIEESAEKLTEESAEESTKESAEESAEDFAEIHSDDNEIDTVVVTPNTGAGMYDAQAVGGQPYGADMYGVQGYGVQNYGMQGYTAEGYTPEGFAQGYAQEGFAAEGYTPEGFVQGYVTEGYAQQGYGMQGYTGQPYEADMYGAQGLGTVPYTDELPPVNSSSISIPGFNVPEDLLRTTLDDAAGENDDNNDDDETWTPRRVRQIRL